MAKALLADRLHHILDDRAMWRWATERLPRLEAAVLAMLREVEAEDGG